MRFRKYISATLNNNSKIIYDGEFQIINSDGIIFEGYEKMKELGLEELGMDLKELWEQRNVQEMLAELIRLIENDGNCVKAEKLIETNSGKEIYLGIIRV